MIITLDNVVETLKKENPINKKRIYPARTRWKQYVLTEDVRIQLSLGHMIRIPKGFQWDLSSVPRLFWPILPPDGDFEIAALIHDYLYINKSAVGVNRKQADQEMLIWSNKVNDHHWGKLLDNRTRYIGVRWFGWLFW